MIDPRITTVADLLRKIRDMAGNLHEILAPEIMSYEIVRGDLERKRGDMKRLEDEMVSAKLKIEKSNELAAKIIQTAKEEADRVAEAVAKANGSKIFEAERILNDCKQFAMELDRKRYLKLREDAEKSVERVASGVVKKVVEPVGN